MNIKEQQILINKTAQLFLKSKGFYDDEIDGIIGPQSRIALQKYKETLSLEDESFFVKNSVIKSKLFTEEVKLELNNLWNFSKIENDRENLLKRDAQKILSNQDRYKKLEKKTGVPWQVIGVIHLRESDCNFNTHLHNGDSLRERTKHIPRGRPIKGTPPFTWEESAEDALEYDGFTKYEHHNWNNPAFTLWMLEKFNGLGYRMKEKPSPYIWGGTNIYKKGKYTSDGRYDSEHVDKQSGCAALLKLLDYGKTE